MIDKFSRQNPADSPDIDLHVVARKASASLESRENEIIRKWLKKVIDDMELASLQSLPTKELSTSFPLLIACVARNIEAIGHEPCAGGDLQELATCMATMRRGEPVAAKLFDDYATLKNLILEAAAVDLRSSDAKALKIFQRLDDSFMQFFKIGMEAFIEQHSQELQRLANTDALTGLFNVRYFRKQLSEKLEIYRRYRLPFSLMMLDIDRLKQLNDREGHEAGDSALIHLAQIMVDEKRESDIAVRSGGDEFFLIVPNTGIVEAESLAQRIIEKVRQISLSESAREMTDVSIGIVNCPMHGDDVGCLRARADQALYLAKKSGGGAIASYPENAIEDK